MFKNAWPFFFSVPCEKISHPLFEQAGISFSVLRLDACDPLTGGNKWFKLYHNLAKAKKEGFNQILTFGGAYSNHIAATAAACKKEGLKSIGIIRGEEANNITLQRASSQGMKLKFVSRDEYRKYREEKDFSMLEKEFGSSYIIPEGGSNDEGVKGCELIAEIIPSTINHIFLPVGTGATLAGLVRGLKTSAHISGVACVKSKESLERDLHRMINDPLKNNKYSLLHDYTFGGYAKRNQLLDEFVKSANESLSFKTEPIYTGRALYAVTDMVTKGFFKRGDEIMLIHTGGLQYLD